MNSSKNGLPSVLDELSAVTADTFEGLVIPEAFMMEEYFFNSRPPHTHSHEPYTFR